MNRKGLFICAMILLLGVFFSVCAEEAVLEVPEKEVFTELGTEENLAEGYIYQILYPRKTEMLRAPRLAGNSLTGANREIYDCLKRRAASVAAGTENCSIVEFTAEEVYGKSSFTAEELGVSQIIADGSFTPEAVEAIRNLVYNCFDQNVIFHCLMADCPYEMYWYDKTVGSLITFPRLSSDGETVNLVGNVTFYIPVSEEYRDTGYEQIRQRYCYIDTAWGLSVDQALENAQAIVSAYEDLEDYDRLHAYKEEIKALTEYNAEAAAEGLDYGNPWQLVWVFDGDPETKVVCEGFSKAFQYLNDLSASPVTVISVTGNMDGEGHMWNIVRMDDGQNYLADITNCYINQDGDEFLFLNGYREDAGNGRYLYQSGETTIIYVFDGDNGIHGEENLVLTGTGYLAAKPATPVFTAGENAEDFQIGETVGFVYQEDPDISYDGFLVKITFTPANGGERRVSRQTAQLSVEGVWQFGPEYHEAGTYEIQFAGRRGSYTSLWSEVTWLTPEVVFDLGRIGFTWETLAELESGYDAGDEQLLEWEGSEKAVSYRILMQEQGKDGETPFDESFSPSETEALISWAVCPGLYSVSLLPEVETGYAYSIDDPITVTVRNSGRTWLTDGKGTLTKYFGSESEVTVPESLDETEVVRVGAEAFARSKARSVMVPSFIDVDPEAFLGNEKLVVIYGYTNSKAEVAAQEAGIPFSSMGIKPETPVCVMSSEVGYTGYALVVQFSEAADSVKIRETGEVITCNGVNVLIPLTEAGEFEYTLAAVKDGVRGDYGETLTLTVHALGQVLLSLPGQVREIGEEAFAGTSVSVIVLPETVQAIGERAFAGSGSLQVVELEGDEFIADDVFLNCVQPVFCVLEYSSWFEKGFDFLTKQE